MSEITQRRFMYKLIRCLMDKAAQPDRCELGEIVDEILKTKDTPFDAGYFFIYDQVKKSFNFGGIFPQKFAGTEDEIKEELTKSACNPDNLTPVQGCGLFCYVAKSFKKDCEDDNNYILINDLKKFKKKNELAKYYINIDFVKKEVKSEYVFPVYINNERQNGFDPEINKRILHAVIVLVSFKKNNIPKSELRILSELISFIISNEAKKVANKAFHDFINTLSNFERVLFSKEEYENITLALKKLYESENNDTLKQCQLKHASIWTLNVTDPENKFLIKEKNFYFPEESAEITNIITNKKIEKIQEPHYFYQFIIDQVKKIEGTSDPLDFKNLIDINKFQTVSKRFYEKNQFEEMYNLQDNDIVVLFPIIPHIENEPTPHKYNNIGLMALYFDNNTFSYYYNEKFLEIMSHKICENMKIVISKTRRDIRESIFEDISETLEKEENFYYKASDVIKEKIDFEFCLIYLFNENMDSLELKTRETETMFPKVFNINSSDAYNIIYNFINDENATRKTINYIRKLGQGKDTRAHLIWSRRDFRDLNHRDDNLLYSTMLIPIKIAQNRVTGVMVCLNNKRNINTTEKSDRSFFSFKDYEIASIGAEVIGVYVEILNHATMSRKILQRLAHEIPAQASFIMQNIKQIREEFKNVYDSFNFYKINLSSIHDIEQIGKELTKDPENFNEKRNHILNLIEQQNQAAFRIQLFSEFTRLKNLDNIDVKKEAEVLDMWIFLSSIISGLRLNAKKNGVFVEFEIKKSQMRINTLDVHPLFRLAVWNLINNAIQYAFFGTTAYITFENSVNFDYIHVENIGIPIQDDIKGKIFEENFRGKEAKTKFFQGTGLGLTLAKKVVEAHGGEIIVEARNNICKRNIFGIFEIEKILENISSEKKKGEYINRKSPKHREYSDFKKELEFSDKEKQILDEYEKFSIYKSSRSVCNMIKDYLETIFDENENLEILFENHIKVPISYVKFTIKLKKESR